MKLHDDQQTRRGYAAGRRQARELALQALFELDMTEHPPEQVLEDRFAEGLEGQPLPPQYAGFTRRLVNGAWGRRPELDARIAESAPQWPLDQLPVVEKTILRLAIFELCFDNETPPRAAINEAVDLAKAYGGEHSGRFVNGVLGSIAAKADRGGDGHGRVDV